MSLRNAIYALALALLVSPLLGEDAAAQAGLLTGGAEKLDPITLSSGQPLAKAPYQLEAGQYYKLGIVADGSAELAISGADFFRNVRVDEVVINDIEGPATISFVTIRPGTFTLRIPGTTGESQQAVFNVK